MKKERQISAVTGGLRGFAGRAIVEELLRKGKEVRVLTNSCDLDLEDSLRQADIEVSPLNFELEGLLEALKDVTVLYITYWVRFGPYDQAVKNLLILIEAAKQAGVERVIYISITNPSKSFLGYFRGKAEVEQKLISSGGIPYAILRPAVLFGGSAKKSILVNNIAWILRHFPVFGVFGKGDYCLQPIHTDDLARIAVEQGQKKENCIINAIGEIFTYRELVETVGKAIGISPSFVSIPPLIGFLAGWVIGKFMHDILISRDEIRGLMQNLLYVPDARPVGKIKLADWLESTPDVGKEYASELALRNPLK